MSRARSSATRCCPSMTPPRPPRRWALRPVMSEPLWTSDEIVAATGGRLNGPPFPATGVSIDSRSSEPGDLFVALAGARDGHDFIDAALARGASGALAGRP